MKNCIFTPEAIGVMLNESFIHGGHIESGGLYVGPKEYPNIITAAIPSSAHAERKPATYYQSEEDVKILNSKLRSYQDAGFDYRGDFHKHPSGMHSLSSGDINTCREILTNPNYEVNNYLIMCIITETRMSDSPIFAYEVKLNNNQVSVQKMEIKIMSMECIEHFIKTNNTIKENDDENINSGHSSGGTQREKPSRTFRLRYRRDDDNMLIIPKGRIQESCSMQ